MTGPSGMTGVAGMAGMAGMASLAGVAGVTCRAGLSARHSAERHGKHAYGADGQRDYIEVHLCQMCNQSRCGTTYRRVAAQPCDE
jgi:hypothetical protein